MGIDAHFGTVNWFSEYLSHLRDEHGFEADALHRILKPIQAAISQARKRIDDLGEPQNKEQHDALDSIADEECAYIEDLIGVAFVACQTYITQTVSRALHLHQFAR